MTRTNGKGGWRLSLLIATVMSLAGSVRVLPAMGSADEVKTAEQAFKNIKVLVGMPESQLSGSMAYMEASLGAKNCEYCHVRSGEREMAWEKDDNPKKETARRMIQMVLDINKASFNGRPEVTCYTCHQGHEHPVAVPALPLPSAEAETAAPRPAGKFPTPAELIVKYVQAIGGKDAAAKFTALALKGTQTGQNGAAMQVEVHWKAPGKILSAVATPGGTFSQGFDGAAGWTQGRNATREMNPAEMARMKEIANAYDPIKLREPYPRMRLIAKEKVDGREAWVLRVQESDNRSERLYFDTETGLLVREVILTPTMIGTIPEQIDFQDYRETDRVRLPFTIRLTGLNPRGNWEQKFSTIQGDASIDDGMFAKPPAGESKSTEQR